MNPILLATDGSPSADDATRDAIDLALALELPLHVVVVSRIPHSVGFGYGAIDAVAAIADVEREHAHEVADRVAERARSAGVETTVEVREGVAADEICVAAHERAARMIVLGAHGWSSVRRFVLGSVSSRVLHEAPCAVLVVRAAQSEPLARHDELHATAAV